MTFSQNLRKTMKIGNLTVADLALIFRRSHATLRGWVQHDREPRGTPADLKNIRKTLADLNRGIIKYGAIPPAIGRQDRKRMLEKFGR